MYSNMFSADAASRRVLYYYYDVVAVSVGRQRIEWEIWLKGARHAGSPENNAVQPRRAAACSSMCGIVQQTHPS